MEEEAELSTLSTLSTLIICEPCLSPKQKMLQPSITNPRPWHNSLQPKAMGWASTPWKCEILQPGDRIYPLVIHGRRENCLLQTYEVGYGRPKKFSGVAAAANVEAPLPQKRRGRAYKKSIRQRSQTSWEMVGIVDWFIDPSEPKHILFGFYIWDWTPWRKGWTQVVDEAGSTPHWKHLHRTWSQTAQQKTTRLQMICRSACNLGDFPLPHFNCTQRERYYKLIIQTVFAMFPLLHQAPWGWPLALLSRSIWQLLVKPNFQRSKLLCAIGFSTRRFLSRKSFWSSKTQKACTLAIAFGSCKALQWRSYPTSPREPARLL